MKWFMSLLGMLLVAATLVCMTPQESYANHKQTIISVTAPVLATSCQCVSGGPCLCAALGTACTCGTAIVTDAPLFTPPIHAVLASPYLRTREVIRSRRAIIAVPLTTIRYSGVSGYASRQKHFYRGHTAILRTKVTSLGI